MTGKKLLEIIPEEMKVAHRWLLVNDSGEPMYKEKERNYFRKCNGEYLSHLITLSDALTFVNKSKKYPLSIRFVTGDGWGEFPFPNVDSEILTSMKLPRYIEHFENDCGEDCQHIIGQSIEDYNGDLFSEVKIITITGATTLTKLTEPEQDQQEEPLPEWIMETEYNGRVTKKVNEPLFCEIFRKENTIARINGVFFLNGEQVSDDLILSMIQSKISPYFVERTGRKTNDLFITLQNNSFVRQPTPDESKIFCDGDMTITIDKDGNISTAHENIFSLSRLSVEYDPESECPVFIRYLNDLLYPEDIPAVQEFIGYCLIPSTRAQAGLFIHGQGGEGKSVLTTVMSKMFNHGAVQEAVDKLSERFILANLEHKLVCIDDDMKTDKLSDTATLKKLITNSPSNPIQVERKNKQKYDAFIYARVFAIGNSFIGSKFDHSDGFYRRQLLIDCKPKVRPEDQDDRLMDVKCIAEINGIFNWALAGLIRLVKNGYHFTISDRMKRTLDDVRHEGDNSLTFFEDDSVITVSDNWDDQVTSADLFTAYSLWCYDNGETPLRRRSFLNRSGERFKIYKIRIQTEDGKLQGFSHMTLSANMRKRVDYLDEKTADRIKRLP